MIEQDVAKKHVADAVVKYVHGRTLRPTMNAGEARDLIRAYLRAAGLREDSYGNFKNPSDPNERYHFSRQRVQLQRKHGRQWSNVRSYSPTGMARKIVISSSKTVGDSSLEDRFRSKVKAEGARRKKAKRTAAEGKVAAKAKEIAQKAFAMNEPELAVKVGSGVVMPSSQVAHAKDRIQQLTRKWTEHLLAGGAAPLDSAFATVDSPPVLPVFLPYEYTWSETVNGVTYSVHVENAEKGTANVSIGGYGRFSVDPRTHRMLVPDYETSGDASISARVVWDEDGKQMVGVMFMITALNQKRGAGSRVMELWCRMMRGYGVSAWIGEAVGPEGMKFLRALERKGKIKILGGDSKNLVMTCRGKCRSIASNSSRRKSSRKNGGSGPSSYLVEMMQWEGLEQLEDRKQRVADLDVAVRIALDFAKCRPRPSKAKVFVTAMSRAKKLGKAMVLVGDKAGWAMSDSSGIEDPVIGGQVAGELAKINHPAGSQVGPVQPLPEGFEGFEYFQPNPVEDPYVYHVTFYNRLSSISDRGLVPVGGAQGSTLGRGGYAGHSQGKVFLTELEGVPFWYGGM